MKDADLFARLDGVRETSPNSWIACCPVHKGPSLNIRRIGTWYVVHCFSGCDDDAVIRALNLSWGEAFPDRALDESYQEQQSASLNARYRLARIAHELTLAIRLIREMTAGGTLTPDDQGRLWIAYDQILKAADLANGSCT